jgi:methionyl aminopeptidase
MQAAEQAVLPGITTAELDRVVEDCIRGHAGAPATKGMRGFPNATCISVNHVVCHGIPSTTKRLMDGDLVKIAFKVGLGGWHAGIARTVHAGSPTPRGRLLVERAWQALAAGIAVLRSGATTGDLGHAIQQVAEARQAGVSFQVVRELGGHGIGQEFFMDPHVPHHGRPGEGDQLTDGMCLSVQPILVAGKADIKTLPDGWSIVTRDRSWSAQVEDTVVVTGQGAEILTRPA